MKALYIVGKICLYTGLVITALITAVFLAAARAGKVS